MPLALLDAPATAVERGALPQGDRGRYTGESLLRTRPKTYQRVVNLLADPAWSVRSIADNCKVSENTITAVRTREAVKIEERKRALVNLFSDSATLGAEKIVRGINKASFRDTTIAAGVSVDKMLALLGQGAPVQVAVVNMPSEADRDERRALHDKLDAIAQRLNTPSE